MGAKARNTNAIQPEPGISHTDVNAILQILQNLWGHAHCELDHENAYQLTVATILSAQSTDKRVNLVTPALFKRYPTVGDLANADPDEVEDLVRSTGFYRNKTRNIIGMAQMIVRDFGGEFPSSIDEMVRLPGVARKTANVVLGTVFGLATGVVVDTHVKRVSQRLGLTQESDPVKIERDLMQKIPKDQWISFSHQAIWHGRRICHARTPDCEHCALAPVCAFRQAGLGS